MSSQTTMYIVGQSIQRVEGFHLPHRSLHARLGLTLLLTAGWTVALAATRDLTVRLGPMIAHRSLLCVTLLAVVVLVYRGPLRAALAEGRAARAKAAAEPEPEGDAPSAEDAG